MCEGSDDNGCVAQYAKTVHSHSSSDLANAFNDFSALESITLGYCGGVIRAHTFENCINLTDVYYTGEKWSDVIIYEINDPLRNAKIHYI